MTPLEVEFWRKASIDLSIDITTPFKLVLPEGQTLLASALVRHFGPPAGMVVNADYDTLRPHLEYLKDSGFGYASGIGADPDRYERSVMIEVLRDWGWSGAVDRKPTWL